MTPIAKTLVGYLPLAIFAGVMFWRMRTMDKARPLRLRMLWLMPLLFVVLVGVTLFGLPPTGLGIGALLLGMALGAAVGWQRARLMRLHIDGEGESAQVMVRQSRAALLLLMALAGVRALFRSATRAAQVSGTASQANLSANTLLVTDALLGFAVGMIVAHRVGLWRRARVLRATHSAMPSP